MGEGLRDARGLEGGEHSAGWEDQERGREGGFERAFEGWRTAGLRRERTGVSLRCRLLVRRLVHLGGVDGAELSLAGSPSDPGRAVGGEG